MLFQPLVLTHHSVLELGSWPVFTSSTRPYLVAHVAGNDQRVVGPQHRLHALQGHTRSRWFRGTRRRKQRGSIQDALLHSCVLPGAS